jgi:hypothetical protein
MKHKYSLRENIRWHLQGFLILVLGALVIGFIVLCAVMIVMP